MIYLDNAATTAPLDEVKEFALGFLNDYYNPSALYKPAVKVAEFIKEAREFIASKAMAGGELIFTSGGTEADNLAIFSSFRRGNAVVSAGEHSAVYEPMAHLKTNRDVRFAPLLQDGSVDADALCDLVDNETTFVSVVHVNNETGAINDINNIASKVKQKNKRIIFHSDGVQAFGKIVFPLSDAVDLYSVSAHKIGGFKGVGALIKRKNVFLHPLIYGGGQENGMRSGTENVMGIASFYMATRLAFASLKERLAYVSSLKKTLADGIGDKLKIISPQNGSPYILTASAVGARGEVLQHMLEDAGIIVGTGSACSSQKKGSRIMRATGADERTADGVIRMSFFVGNTAEEMKTTAGAIVASAEKLIGMAK